MIYNLPWYSGRHTFFQEIECHLRSKSKEHPKLIVLALRGLQTTNSFLDFPTSFKLLSLVSSQFHTRPRVFFVRKNSWKILLLSLNQEHCENLDAHIRSSVLSVKLTRPRSCDRTTEIFTCAWYTIGYQLLQKNRLSTNPSTL